MLDFPDGHGGRWRIRRIPWAGMAGHVVLAVALTVPSAGLPAFAADEVPALVDNSRKGCVKGSPVVATSAGWGTRRLAPDAVWPLSRGKGAVVAIVDSGISARPPALAGAVTTGADLTGGAAPERDCRGRGTLLAGLVAGRPQPGSAATGLAPDALVMPIKVVTDDGTVLSRSVVRGIRQAVDRGASVILVTAGPVPDSADLRRAVAAAAAEDVLVVASVGNAKENGASPVWYPAGYPDVIAVGGVNQAGTPVQRLAPGQRVDLVAPGSQVYGPAPIGSGNYQVGGPSPAAAQVAGAAALIRSRYPRSTAPEVRRRLLATARPPAAGADRAGPLGAGSLDLYAAVAALDVTPQKTTGQQRPLRLPTAPAESPRVRWAAATGAGALFSAVLVFTAASVVRFGRKRRRGHTR